MASGFQNIGKIPELRRRILFTLTLLAVYRIGVFVTTPGVEPRRHDEDRATQASGTFLGLFNMFSGGALEQLSIFALGIMPYISASHHPAAADGRRPQRWSSSRRKASRGSARSTSTRATARRPVADPVVLHRALARGQQPRLRAVRPGGHRSGLALPAADDDHADHRHRLHHVARRADHRARHRQRHLADHLRRHRHRHARRRRPHVLEGARPATSPRSTWPSSACSSCVVVAVDHLLRARPAADPRPVRQARGRPEDVRRPVAAHLPLKVNTAGVIPPIFASSILMFPQQIASFVQTPWMQRISEALHPGDWRYNLSLRRR